MNLAENSGIHDIPAVVKPAWVKREVVVPRTTKNYQMGVGQIQENGVY